MNWCILIPIAIGVICALLGYLLGQSIARDENNQIDVSVYKSRIAQLESDLAKSKTHLNVQSILFDADAAKAAFGKKIKENDLTIIEGIGPKIQELFHNHDIKTWKALSECSVAKCQTILDSGGSRYKMHRPDTWPEQAKMAYHGKWNALLNWQQELHGGM